MGEKIRNAPPERFGEITIKSVATKYTEGGLPAGVAREELYTWRPIERL
jgi:hypothetical protein